MNPDQLIVGGGDGTIRTAAEIMLGSNIPLFILPVGTANVMANNLKIPTGIKKALAVGVKNKSKTISLGRANGKLFTAALTIGVSNKVYSNLDSKRKAALGNWAYLAQGVIEFSKHKPFLCRLVTSDGNDVEFTTHQVTALNGSFGVRESFKIYPPHDLSVNTIKIHTYANSPKKIHHITNAIRQMQKKAGDKFVNSWEVKQATLTAFPKQNVALDAELITQTPLEIEVIPNALKVIAANK
jgi:diacylglycerol kinase family enzyme